MEVTQLITLGIEIILVSLLAVVLMYLVRVHSRVQSLRKDYKHMREVIASLDAATVRAQSALSTVKRFCETTESTLSVRLASGEALIEELRTMIEAGDRIADRLLHSVNNVSHRQKSGQAGAREPAPAPAPASGPAAELVSSGEEVDSGVGKVPLAAANDGSRSGGAQADKGSDEVTISRDQLLLLQKFIKLHGDSKAKDAGGQARTRAANNDRAANGKRASNKQELAQKLRDVVGLG